MEDNVGILTENWCDECGEHVCAVFNREDFFAHKIGTVRCPVCGHINMPCNECEDHDACGDCPWSHLQDCEASDSMSDEAFVRYAKAYYPKAYEYMAAGDLGDTYYEIAMRIEKEDEEKEKKKKAS